MKGGGGRVIPFAAKVQPSREIGFSYHPSTRSLRCSRSLLFFSIYFLIFFCQPKFGSSSSDSESSSSATAQAASSSGVACRTETGFNLPFDPYALDTCAKCYFYMPTWAFVGRLSYVGSGQLHDFWTNTTYLSNETAILEKTFLTQIMAQKWKECCHLALACCVDHLAVRQPPSAGCPRTWDGWTCWPEDVAVGVTSSQPCPRHIYWRMTAPPCRGYVTKTCSEEGKWFSMEMREWTNYTNCARDDIYLRRLRYSIVTHLISVAFIIPALFIFNYYRQLSSTPRIRLHKHLFACLLLYATMSALLKLNLLKAETTTAEDQSEGKGDSSSLSPSGNSSSSVAHSSETVISTILAHMPTYCLVLSLASRYFRSATYLWMFNEAFYLHQLIKRAFTQPSVTPLIALAYGLSGFTTIAYVICRSLVGIADTAANQLSQNQAAAEDKSHDVCWLLPATDPWKEYVINGPNLCILLVNCLLLLPIIVEIYKKANSTLSPSPYGNHQRQNVEGRASLMASAPGNGHHQQPHQSHHHPKGSFIVPLRAATLLLPLYGLHYLVIVYRPDINVCWLSELYHYGSLTLDGLQGALVSILFCFANNEVRQLLWKSCSSKRENNVYLTEIIPAPQ